MHLPLALPSGSTIVYFDKFNIKSTGLLSCHEAKKLYGLMVFKNHRFEEKLLDIFLIRHNFSTLLFIYKPFNIYIIYLLSISILNFVKLNFYIFNINDPSLST